MSAGMRFDLSCRQCGGELHEINPGHTDGVRAIWVGKCDTCRREFMVEAVMRALSNVSTSNQFTRNRGAA
jgi:hypothetical protein